MKKIANKRWILLSALVLVMAVATGGYAVGGLKSHFGHGGKGFVKERMISKMDYAMQELKLTPKQQAEYNAIREKISTTLEQAAERHGQVKDSIFAEMERPQPDIKALAGKVKKEVNAIPDTVTVQIDYLLEVYDILNQSQQQQLVTMLKERMERHKHHMEKRRDKDRS